MRRVLDGVLAALGNEAPPWLQGDRDGFVARIAAEAPERFARAFDRWRDLYASALQQLSEANRRSEMAGLGAGERRKVNAAQAQANEQIAILAQVRASNNSDFCTYRYLATEGFLFGYNFPRLPVYAYVSAAHATGGRGAFLPRAHFLALSEFGPAA